MLSWGENFDVAAEFAGLISRFNEGQRRQQRQLLEAKGLSNLTAPEREQYRLLQQRVWLANAGYFTAGYAL